MSDDKVFYPETIEQNTLPVDGSTPIQQLITETSSKKDTNGNEVFSQPQILQRNFRRTQIADEVISSSLDTSRRKILDSYEFGQLGAIKIGNYKSGVSGQISITPRGIVAKNKDGLDTFSIDGETGDAIFRGAVQAGDFTVVDENGIVSSNVISYGSISGTPNQEFHNTSWETQSNASLTIVTNQVDTRILFTLTLQSASSRLDGVSDCSGRTHYKARIIDQSSDVLEIFYDMFYTTTHIENAINKTYSTMAIVNVSDPGTHTLSLQRMIDNNSNLSSELYSFNLSYVQFGK